MSCDGWQRLKLCEIYDFSSGLSKSAKEFGYGFPFLSFKIVFNNYFIPNNIEDLANTTQKEQEKCSIQKGDLFLTRTSESLDELGMSCVALKDYPKATFNGFTKRLRAKKLHLVDPKYAGYYFRSIVFRKTVTSMASMTTRASLNNSMLSQLPLTLPPIRIQEKIGHILFSLDEKIELNNRMNKTLEEIAQTLFKRWFVDFEFPDENGDQYKSAGGKMVESELGEIPEGWEVHNICNIIDIKYGRNLPSSKLLNKGYPVYGGNGIIGYYSDFMYHLPQVLVSCRGAASGKVHKSIPMSYVTNNSLILETNNSHVFSFIYYLSVAGYYEYATGSAQPQITIKNLSKHKIALPNENLMIRFNELVEHINDHVNSNSEQSINVSSIRDTLLPKLMSGEVRVPITEE